MKNTRSSSPRYSTTDTAAWTAVVSDLTQLVLYADANSLAQGDRLVRIAERFGEPAVQVAAEQAGIPLGAAMVRLRVSRKFRPGDPVRKLPLTFSHLLMLVDIQTPLAWGLTAVENQWSAARLHSELELERDHVAARDGEPCTVCGQPLGPNLVRVNRAKERSVRYCSSACASEHLRAPHRRRDPFG